MGGREREREREREEEEEEEELDQCTCVYTYSYDSLFISILPEPHLKCQLAIFNLSDCSPGH